MLESKQGGNQGSIDAQKQEIGNTLRQKRKDMNISLREAESATSIRMVYLQALEAGEMEKLISPVYAQGFFKQYAALLGLDGETIVRNHPEIFSRMADSQDFAYGIGTLEFRGNPSAGIKWFPNILWTAAFLLVLMIAWYLAKGFGVV